MNTVNLKKISFWIFLVFAIFNLKAQDAIEVIYHHKAEDTEKKPVARLLFAKGVAYLSDRNDKIQEFIDYNRGAVVTIIKYEDRYYKTVEKFIDLPQPKLQQDEKKILNYLCKKAVFKAFSNTIEIWYTEKAPAKGSPYKNYLPGDALVLKIKVNGSPRMIATSLKKIKDPDLFYPFEQATPIDKARLRELQIKSRYVRVPVFEKEVVNFDPELKNCDLTESNKTYHCSKGTVLLKKIKLPDLARKGAQVFITLTNWSNGDAYDRTGSVFTIAGKKEKNILEAFRKGIQVLPVFKGKDGKGYQGISGTVDYEVPVELMRFFTSFGVSHFNHKREINNYIWRDSVVYKQEITSLIPDDRDEMWIGVFIGNYDKGGHKVSLELDFYPPWDPDERVSKKYITPLFSTVNVLEMSGQNYGRLFKTDTLTTTFTIPENVQGLKLLYTSTGHGGWGEGDEFVQRLNEIFIDGKPVFKQVPWRTDCGTYRLSNPSSGNFKNGLSSSDLSRSNWCPSTLTPPEFIPLDNLKSGTHTIQVVIHQGADEENSFSHWSVSGVLTGTYKDKDDN